MNHFNLLISPKKFVKNEATMIVQLSSLQSENISFLQESSLEQVVLYILRYVYIIRWQLELQF